MKFLLALLSALTLFSATPQITVQVDTNGLVVAPSGISITNANTLIATNILDGRVLPTGATVGRSLSDIAVDEKYNVRLQGAIPNDGLDDSAAFQAAINYLQTNVNVKNLYIPEGTWLWTNQVVITNSINFIGPNGLGITTITSSYSGIALLVTGSMTQLPDIASTIALGATNVTFVGAHSLSPYDLILAHNTNDSSYSAARTYYRQGEWMEVATIASSTSITLANPTFATYTGTTNKFWKMNAIQFGMHNINMRTRTGLGTAIPGIQLNVTRDLIIQHSTFRGSQYAQIYANKTFNSYFDNNSYHDFQATIGNNYGIAIVGQNITLNDQNGTVARHLISVGSGTEDGHVVNRNIIIHGGFQQTYGTSWATDFHGNNEFYIVENVRGNGVAAGGDHFQIVNNTFDNWNASGYAIALSEMRGLNGLISGNKIFAKRSFNNGIISLFGRTNVIVNSVLTVANNYVDVGLYASSTYPSAAAKIIEFGLTGGIPPNTNITVNIVNNTFKTDTTTAGPFYAVDYVTASTYGMKEINVDGNYAHNLGYRFSRNIVTLNFNNNKSFDALEYGLRTTTISTPSITNQVWNINNNYIVGSKLNPVSLIGSVTSWDVHVRRNTFKNGTKTTPGAAFVLAAARILWLEDNMIGDDQGTPTHNATYTVQTVTYFNRRNNRNPGMNLNALTFTALSGIGTLTELDTHTHAATDIGTGVVDNTEFNYLNGVTAAIQTQLNNKQPIATELTSIDTVNPGNNYYYGTDGSGVKNFYAIPGATAVTNIATFALSDLSTALTTGDDKNYWNPPYAIRIIHVKASVLTASSLGALTFDIKEAGTTLMAATKLTIDVSETDSSTAAVAAVVSDTDIAANAKVGFQIVGAGANAAGAQVTIVYIRI